MPLKATSAIQVGEQKDQEEDIFLRLRGIIGLCKVAYLLLINMPSIRPSKKHAAISK
jgi:hypothetical protein